MKQLLALLLLVAAATGNAEDLSRSFPVGTGSRFSLQSTLFSGDIVISVAASRPRSVAIEYFFSTHLPMGPVEMWQQFDLEHSGSGPVRIASGYLYTKEMTVPERIESRFLSGLDGLDLNAFLFKDDRAIKKFEVGREAVSVPAGNITATHYRQSLGGKTFDYWVSDAARPIGLVKLEEHGAKGSMSDVTVSLTSLVKNVGRKIDPTKAVPMTKKGRALMALLPTRLP